MRSGSDRDLRSADGVIERDPERGDDAGIPERLLRAIFISLLSSIDIRAIESAGRKTHHPKVEEGGDEQSQPDQTLQFQLVLQPRARSSEVVPKCQVKRENQVTARIHARRWEKDHIRRRG